MVAVSFAIVAEEDVLVADGLGLCTTACAAGVEESPHKLVRMVPAEWRRIPRCIACSNTTGANFVNIFQLSYRDKTRLPVCPGLHQRLYLRRLCCRRRQACTLYVHCVHTLLKDGLDLLHCVHWQPFGTDFCSLPHIADELPCVFLCVF